MLPRTILGAWFLGFALTLAGCSDDADPPEEHGHDDVADVVYVGRTTDEALLYMLDRTPQDVESQRLVIDSPADGATLSKDAPETFSYHFAATGRAEPPRPPAGYVAPDWKRRVLTDFGNLFGPVRDAHAHGTPFSGLAYYLELEDADGNRVLRVFTDETSYTPESTTWAALAELAQPLTLTIFTAVFEDNDVPAGGGPYLGGSAAFRIE